MKSSTSKPDAALTEALSQSMHALRMAAQLLESCGLPAGAGHMRIQADKNLLLLNKTVGLL